MVDVVDVHILLHPTQDRSAKLDPLLEALDKEPVNIHLVTGYDRLIGKGRAEGFRLGTSEVVSYVDDDDEIIEGAFTHILECFAGEPEIDGCCTREEINRHGGEDLWAGTKYPFLYYNKVDCRRIHHITAYNRASIEPYLDQIIDKPTTSEHHLAALLLKDEARIKHIPIECYRWNEHAGSSPWYIRHESNPNLTAKEKLARKGELGLKQESIDLYKELFAIAAHEKNVLKRTSHIPEQQRISLSGV